MAFCGTSFNGNPGVNFVDAIVDVLTSHIFDGRSKQQLLDRYNEMKAHCTHLGYYVKASPAPPKKGEFEKKYFRGFCSGKFELQRTFCKPCLWYTFCKSCCSCCVYDPTCFWGKYNLGHDLPVWINAGDTELFSNDQVDNSEDDKQGVNMFEKIKIILPEDLMSCENKTVMLIGMDPMRKKQTTGLLSLSTPWGIHSANYRIRKKSPAKRVWQLISSFVVGGWNVYITDRSKLYATYDSNNLHKVDIINAITFKPMMDCLLEEINIVKPNVIIFIGDGIQGFLLNEFFKQAYTAYPDLAYFHIPHPRNPWDNVIVSYVSQVTSTSPLDAELHTYEIK